MIRILMYHDVAFTGAVLKTVLQAEDDLTVVGQATTPVEMLEKLAATPCDLVVVLLSPADDSALVLTRAVAKYFSSVKIVLIGLPESHTLILRYLEAGAAGYVRETDSVKQLLAVIRRAAHGDALVTPEVAGVLVARVHELKRLAMELNGYHEANMEQQSGTLSGREREVLQLLGEGYRNNEIAEELVITVGTVKNHVHNILDKLDVHTRKQAAMVARQLAVGEEKADKGTKFTWTVAEGVEVTLRRDAAGML